MIEPKWKYKSVNKEAVDEVAELFNLPQSIAHVMSIRGINSKDISRTFFYPENGLKS